MERSDIFQKQGMCIEKLTLKKKIAVLNGSLVLILGLLLVLFINLIAPIFIEQELITGHINK